MSSLAADPAPTFDDIKRMLAELALSQKETARKFQEIDRKFQEIDRTLKERTVETDYMIKAFSNNLDDIGDRMGEFVEHMVEPSIIKLFRSQGIETEVSRFWRGQYISVC